MGNKEKAMKILKKYQEELDYFLNYSSLYMSGSNHITVSRKENRTERNTYERVSIFDLEVKIFYLCRCVLHFKINMTNSDNSYEVIEFHPGDWLNTIKTLNELERRKRMRDAQIEEENSKALDDKRFQFLDGELL